MAEGVSGCDEEEAEQVRIGTHQKEMGEGAWPATLASGAGKEGTQVHVPLRCKPASWGQIKVVEPPEVAANLGK